MHLLWHETEETIESDGCRLSEKETELLIRLCSSFTYRKLSELGFNDDEVMVIMNWGLAI